MWFSLGVVTVLFDKFQKNLAFKATALFSVAIFFVAVFLVVIGSVSDLVSAKSLVATETALLGTTHHSVPSFGFFITKNLWKGGVILGLGIPLSILVFGRLLAPIKELIRVAKCAANGDLTARVAFSRKDEFGALANSINLMLERMKANIDHIFR